MLRRTSVALMVAASVMGVFAAAVSADPVNAKFSLTFPADCEGQSVQVVVNGNGEFSPAHVIGSTAVFVPQAFHLTSEFTPSGGEPDIETDTSSKRNPHGDLVTCRFDTTQTFPDGSTLHLFGTATGFLTPAS